MQDYKLYDSKKTAKCLQRKRIVLLGDSTMGETFHDLAILLSGIGKNKKELDTYIHQAAIKSEKEHEMWRYALPNDVTLTFWCCRRNLTLDMPKKKLQIAYRFIGNPILTRNDYGVKTLLDESIHDELHCILGLLPGCPIPDVVIINSGLHDRNSDHKEFVSILTQAMNMIKQGFGKEGYEKNVRILWKGLFIGKWDTIRDKKILLDSLSKVLSIWNLISELFTPYRELYIYNNWI